MKEDKLDIFTGVKLEEIHKVVKDNGRNIADNSIKIDLLSDNVRDMSEVITEMKEDINTLVQLNIEQKKTNQDISVLLNQIISLTKDMRRDLDKIIDKDEVSYQKVGAM